jgi:hypothetical protein
MGELEDGRQAVRRQPGVDARDLEGGALEVRAFVVPSSDMAICRKSCAVDM